MKIIFCAFWFCLLSCSSADNKQGNHSFEFRDCIDFFDLNYCLQFEIDSSYIRTLELNGSGWGPTKSYRFISAVDTIVVSIFILKDKKCDTVSVETAKKALQDKLFKSYGCVIKDYRALNYFFEGSIVTCTGNRKNILEYYGSNHRNFQNNEVGIYIGSESSFSTNTIYDNFMQLIRSVKVINMPQNSTPKDN
jgi:hypothetical protein